MLRFGLNHIAGKGMSSLDAWKLWRYSGLMRCLAFILILLLPLAAHAHERGTGMVVAAQPAAAQAGAEMLNRGGNAFDAAAATALALGVVEPGSSGLGGGGFFLLYVAESKRFVMIDAREASPRLAGHGEVYGTRSSINGPQAAGVPGLPAGVALLAARYGRLGLQRVAAPAIRLAQEGFVVTPRLARLIRWRRKSFNAAARRIYDRRAGDIIRQPALAETLARFAGNGAEEFYRGETAGRLVADMQRDGGLIRRDDLAAYRAVEHRPVTFTYRGYRVVSAALPSSGGMTLAHIFGQLRHDALERLAAADRAHLLIEVMKRAYRDRNRYLGDPRFAPVPRDYLAPERLVRLRASIRMTRATPASALGSLAEPTGAARNTTHFCVIDNAGNMVAATLSINYPFGSGYVSPSTGILLNDEMDDFATRPDRPNAYGLVQGKANAVAPGKRMLSSMTPTFVIGPKRIFIVGTPGGSRIISMVLLASLAFMQHDGPPGQWIAAPRFHHQFLPDVVQFEPGAFSDAVAASLRQRGHTLQPLQRRYGNMQAIICERETRHCTGLTDPRGEGMAAGAGITP